MAPVHDFPSGHAGPKDVKRTEITRDKKIVWTHRDETKPGIHHFQILDTVEEGRRRRCPGVGGKQRMIGAGIGQWEVFLREVMPKEPRRHGQHQGERGASAP